MKIKFKKKYDEDVRWSAVVKDFIDYLSTRYEYPITEYDLIAMHHSVKLDKLGPLVNAGNKEATELFGYYVRRHMAEQERARNVQVEVEKTLTALQEPNMQAADITAESRPRDYTDED